MRGPTAFLSLRYPTALPPRPPPPILSTRPAVAARPRHFSSSALRRAQEQDHYAVLGVSRSASRKEIKEKFYEVSYSTRQPLAERSANRLLPFATALEDLSPGCTFHIFLRDARSAHGSIPVHLGIVRDPARRQAAPTLRRRLLGPPRPSTSLHSCWRRALASVWLRRRGARGVEHGGEPRPSRAGQLCLATSCAAKWTSGGSSSGPLRAEEGSWPGQVDRRPFPDVCQPRCASSVEGGGASGESGQQGCGRVWS